MLTKLEQFPGLRIVYPDVQRQSLLSHLIEDIGMKAVSISKKIKEPSTTIEYYPFFKSTGNYEFELALTSWNNPWDINLQISLRKTRSPFSRQDLDDLNHYAFSLFKPNESLTGGSLSPIKNLNRNPFDEGCKVANLKLDKFPYNASEFLSQDEIEACLSVIDSKDDYLLIIFKDSLPLMPVRF